MDICTGGPGSRIGYDENNDQDRSLTMKASCEFHWQSCGYSQVAESYSPSSMVPSQPETMFCNSRPSTVTSSQISIL